MEIKKIIDGLQFTMQRNDEDKTTIDACREAIKILGHLERGSMVSEYRTFKVLEAIKNKCENSYDCYACPYDMAICFYITPSDWELEKIKPKLLNGGENDGN